MGINDLVFKDEVETNQIPADGVLPEIGGYVPPLPPGKEYIVKIPDTLPQLITLKDVAHEGVTRQRVFLKFDKNNPLIVLGGEWDGHPIMGSFSNIPRPRGREKVEVSDLAYYLVDGCKLTGLNLQTPRDWVNALIRTAGLQAKIVSGRTGQCRPDQDVYIQSTTVDPETGQQAVSYQEVKDMKGCGKRYYTRDFLTPQGYVERLVCSGKRKFTDPATNQVAELPCGASIRGFDGVDRWVK